MSIAPWVNALLGGAAIGLAASLLLIAQGRVAGISGITAALLERSSGLSWRIAFVVGLAAVGITTALVAPAAIGEAPTTLPVLLVAGLLVGFGTRLAGGCTSGHGICGVANLSQRSLVAVPVFVVTGMITVWLRGAP